MREWYIHKEGNSYGPFTEAQLRSALGTGELGLATLVWKEGLAQWQPLALALPALTQRPSIVTLAIRTFALMITPPMVGLAVFVCLTPATQQSVLKAFDSEFYAKTTQRPERVAQFVTETLVGDSCDKTLAERVAAHGKESTSDSPSAAKLRGAKEVLKALTLQKGSKLPVLEIIAARQALDALHTKACVVGQNAACLIPVAGKEPMLEKCLSMPNCMPLKRKQAELNTQLLCVNAALCKQEIKVGGQALHCKWIEKSLSVFQ